MSTDWSTGRTIGSEERQRKEARHEDGSGLGEEGVTIQGRDKNND